MFRWLTSGLLLRILTALLIVSVIPISVIITFTQQSYQTTQTEVVTESQKALDTKAIQGLGGARHWSLPIRFPIF